MERLEGRSSRRLILGALVGVLAAGLVLVQPAQAGDVTKLDNSLKWIPADAAFYSTMLRGREQFQAVAQSRAWAKVKAMPAVQSLFQMVENEMKEGGKLAPLHQFHQDPENQQLVQLLGQMFAEEFFVYGGQNFVPFMDLLAEVQVANSYGPLFMIVSGQGGLESNKGQIVSILRALSNNLNLIQVPDLVFGFKLGDTKRAEAQIKRLEKFLTDQANQFPPLKEGLKREKLAGGDFLTLTLDGSLVPWQRIPFKDFEQKEGEFDKLVKKLSELKLQICLGLRDGYLLFALGESTAVLKKLGGGQRLADRAELKPLARHADKRLTSISYASQAFNAKTQGGQFDSLIKQAENVLPQLGITDEQRDRIRKDLANVAKGMENIAAKAGAVVECAFLTDRGTEGFSYDYGEHGLRDGSKPLTLLNHVGGSPLLAIAGRTRFSPESYQTFVKGIKTLNGHFEEIVLPKLDADKREKYEQVAKVFHPLLQRLDKATGTLLLPALADGQKAFVIDGKLTSKQWIQALPPTDKPLPIPELAVVVGVSDAAKLRKAFAEYRAVINEMMAKLHELQGDIPDIQIPEPQTSKLKNGTMYSYPLPQELGIDSQLLLNAGLSDKVAVVTLSQKHTERLLAATPLKANSRLLAETSKPLAGASYCNWEGMVTMLTPWVEYGVNFALQFRGGGADAESITSQVKTGLDVLKVLRSYSSLTYFEDKVLVTHSETVISDLPAQ
jgi:hypothetical protein